jgi:hypothetical protein
LEFVANAFISPFKTQTMHIKSFYTQQHCYVSLKTLYPVRDLNLGLLVPEADAMSTALRRQGEFLGIYMTFSAFNKMIFYQTYKVDVHTSTNCYFTNFKS